MLGALHDAMTGYLSAGAQLTVGIVVMLGSLVVIVRSVRRGGRRS